ncbi:hypothetical protein CR513_30475, partial [Mucuna pruriens]
MMINGYGHKKLGHVSLKLIYKLKKHNLVRGLPSLVYKANLLCDVCQKGKQVKGSFKSKNFVSNSRPLELLHINLFGLTRTASLGGKHYGLVIVNDYSRWTWVIFLAHKDKSFKIFFILILPLSEVIMGENLKMKTFNSSMKNKEFFINFLVQ